MKILHLVHDEKFIPFVADLFNSCGDISNSFLVIAKDRRVPLRYVADVKNAQVIDKSYINSASLDRDLAHCDCLVVHYLDVLKAKVILRAPAHIPVVWSGWGGDYYDLVASITPKLLGEQTSLLSSALIRSSHIQYRIKRVLKRILNPLMSERWMSKAIKRVNFFSSPVPEDYLLLKNALGGGFTAGYTQINYGSVEHTFASGPKAISGRDILVGNSSSVTNNHMEAFQILSRLDLDERRIVVPLSYGDAAYRDAVIEEGRRMFGENFYPLIDFMPLDEYNSIIAQCSIVVMGHRRQQAVGNVATMLYKGAKIFMDESSTVYSFFKKRGAYVFTLDELDKEAAIFKPLSDDEKNKNREVLEEMWGQEVVMKNVENLVKLIQQHQRGQHA